MNFREIDSSSDFKPGLYYIYDAHFIITAICTCITNNVLNVHVNVVHTALSNVERRVPEVT